MCQLYHKQGFFMQIAIDLPNDFVEFQVPIRGFVYILNLYGSYSPPLEA